MKPRSILVTTALPYANGDLHLGHMVEQIQADIWVRFLKMQGHTCYFVSGDDAHGTAIMLLAEKRGITPEALIDGFHQQRLTEFAGFQIGVDHYHTTHSRENQLLANLIYERLVAKGDITTRSVKQAFDPVKKLFLADRFIKGTCPQCKALDQYGDNCEQCSATYSALELIAPVSVLSGVSPIEKESLHYFFELAHYKTFLQEWTQTPGHLQRAIANKLQEWFNVGLKAWDISRDAPYFGFLIPGTTDKYFYVWLDAPIGYMAAFKHLCAQQHLNFDAYWHKDATTELYHFIGKDIVNFHTLFWPAMLTGADFRTPTAIFTHGYLTVNHAKMSKSRGTFITANTYLNYCQPEYLRYYFAAKLNASVEDIDLNLEDFRVRVNADLIGKVINIASRAASFIHKQFANRLSEQLDDVGLFHTFTSASHDIAHAYETRDYSKAMRLIMELADSANHYVDAQKPWALMKDPVHCHRVQGICTQALNLFRVLMIYLAPVLPEIAKKVTAFFNVQAFTWQDSQVPLLNHTINSYQPLLQRLEEATITLMQNDAIIPVEPVKPAAATINATDDLATMEFISIDDFMKVDLRIAKIVSAEEVPDAAKLIKLQLDIGEERPRQVFAGIKAHFNPLDLIGKYTVMVANLAPRKMRFGLSEGMVIIASKPDGAQLYLIEPQVGAEVGMKVK